MRNLLELAERVLMLRQDRGDIEDYSLLDIINMALVIRRREDRLEYFREKYRRK